MFKNFETFCFSKNFIQKWITTGYNRARSCLKRRKTDQVQFVIPSATVHLARKRSMLGHQAVPGVGGFLAIVLKSFIGPCTEANANYGIM